MQQLRFFGTASIALEVGKSPITIERAIRVNHVTPDAVFVTPTGRELALFSEARMENLKMLMSAPPVIL